MSFDTLCGCSPFHNPSSSHVDMMKHKSGFTRNKIMEGTRWLLKAGRRWSWPRLYVAELVTPKNRMWWLLWSPLQYYELLSIVLQVPCLLDLIPWSPSWITVLSLWWRSSCNSMKLWAMPCRTTQDGPVIVETSEKTWSTGEGNANHSSILTVRILRTV